VRDIWSFCIIWQDFGRNRSLYQRRNHQWIRRGMVPPSCRNLLLTINVLHFLCIADDTPASRKLAMWDGNQIEPPEDPVVQPSPDDYFVRGHDAVRQNREKPS
jgi:hypothetical protein